AERAAPRDVVEIEVVDLFCAAEHQRCLSVQPPTDAAVGQVAAALHFESVAPLVGPELGSYLGDSVVADYQRPQEKQVADLERKLFTELGQRRPGHLEVGGTG